MSHFRVEVILRVRFEIENSRKHKNKKYKSLEGYKNLLASLNVTKS